MEMTPLAPIDPEAPVPVTPAAPPPLPPLVISDSRFEMLKRNLERSFQQKFAKLFKRTKDQDQRFGTVEFVNFLAVFIFDQMLFISSINEKKGPDPFYMFNQQLFGLQDHLRKRIQEQEKANEPKPKPESGPGPTDPAPVAP